MSRNGSGSMSIPNTFTAGTTAVAADVNENFEDIGDEITNSVAADGQTSMTGALKAFAGTEALPGLSFATDTDTGIRRSAANTLALVCNANDVVTVEETEVTLNTGVSLTAHAASFDDAVDFAAAVDVASATTTDIGAAASNTVNITGTTTITGLGTAAAGVSRWVKFAGALTLTHNATSLILPTGANITTAAGDTAYFKSEGEGNWRCYFYQRADGEALVVSEDTYNTFAEGDAKDTPASGKVVGYAKDDGRFYFKDDTGAEIAAYPIGTDQTWQDVKSSRDLNTAYQNTTGKPIQVVAYVSVSSGACAFAVSSDGSTYVDVMAAQTISSGGRGFFSVIVPAGHYYKVTFTGGATITNWAELR